MDAAGPVTVIPARTEPAPLVVDSPHSGMEWPADFGTVVPRESILTTWDAFVDELFAGAPDAGGCLIAARFPRAYIDANRAETDIDPELLASPWPEPLVPTSYTQRGMGLIRRLALPGLPMYDRKLSVEAVRWRIEAYYRPYRAALREQIEACHRRHGIVWHVNCHSMKSRGNEMNIDAGEPRPDLVVSDRRGATADPAVTRAADFFRGRGYSVQLNEPYQGGDLVRSFGNPSQGRHSIQVELNRALYMDEKKFTCHEGFARLKADLDAFLAAAATRAREVAA